MSWRANRELAQQVGISDTRVFVSEQLVPIEEIKFDLLSLNGAGASFGMNVDGTVAKSFRWICPADKVFLFHSLAFHMLDASFDFNGFGAGAALANGLIVRFRDSDDSDLLVVAGNGGLPAIDKMVEFAHFGSPESSVDPVAGAVDDMFTIRWDFHEVTGFVPFLTAGQYVEVVVQDNLTILTHFEATVGGRLLDAS